jgi:hypothetical protein
MGAALNRRTSEQADSAQRGPTECRLCPFPGVGSSKGALGPEGPTEGSIGGSGGYRRILGVLGFIGSPHSGTICARLGI